MTSQPQPDFITWKQLPDDEQIRLLRQELAYGPPLPTMPSWRIGQVILRAPGVEWVLPVTSVDFEDSQGNYAGCIADLDGRVWLPARGREVRVNRSGTSVTIRLLDIKDWGWMPQ